MGECACHGHMHSTQSVQLLEIQLLDWDATRDSDFDSDLSAP